MVSYATLYHASEDTVLLSFHPQVTIHPSADLTCISVKANSKDDCPDAIEPTCVETNKCTRW